MRLLSHQMSWVLMVLLCSQITATPQQPVRRKTAAPASTVTIGKFLGQWKSTRDGSTIVLTQLDRSTVRFEGRHIWSGTYSAGRLELIRYPTAQEMSEKAPEWARRRVQLPARAIGSAPVDSTRHLKWMMTLEYEETCDGIALSGEWDPGEIEWREEKNPATGEIKQTASVSPKGLAIPVKYVRDSKVNQSSARPFSIVRLVVKDAAWERKLLEVQEAIKKQDVELVAFQGRFDEADKQYNVIRDASIAAAARRASIRARLQVKLQEAERILFTEAGIRLRDELVKSIGDLEAEIAKIQSADPNYKNSRAYLDKVSKLSENNEQLQKLLNEAGRFVGRGDRAVKLRFARAEAQKLKNQLVVANQQVTELDAVLQRRFTELNAAFYELESNKQQLDALLKQFDDLRKEFFLRRVTVETNTSERVFEAQLEEPLSLAELNKQLAVAQGAMNQAKPAKEKAFRAFMKESKEATTALQSLESRILINAGGQFVTELGFSIVDLVQAGGKGGLGGFVVEGLRKIGESVTTQLIEGNVGDLSGVNEGSIEAAINLVYEQDILRNPTSIPQLEKLALNRGAKELVTRRLRNFGNRTIGVTIEAARRGSLERLARNASRLDKIGNNLENLLSKQNYKFKDLGKGLLKDGLKTAARKVFQEIEASAWENYFLHDIKARALFPIYQIANKTYLDAFDEYNQLLEEKNKLLSKIDPSAAMTVLKKTSFQEYAPLVITAEPTRSEYQENVIVNDRAARPLGNHRHCFLTPDYRGSVTGMTLKVDRRE